MAYRRRQAVTRAATFQEDLRPRTPLHEDDEDDNPLPPKDGHRRAHSYSAASSSPSLAAEAIRASNVRRDSPLSSGYSATSSFPSAKNDTSKEAYDRGNSNEVEGSSTFWGVLAKKAKALVDDEPFQDPDQIYPTNSQYYYQPYQQSNSRKEENPALRKSLDKIASSLNHIGGQIGNAIEEGRTMVENRTADIIQETRKLQIRRQENNNFNDQNYKLQIRRPENNNFDDQNYPSGMQSPWKSFNKSSQQHVMYSHEDRLKASRDVALATAAKAKVLLRELKTVKADLAFAKERCSQLEDENKLLRDTCEKGGNRADDDMIRLQLETLLAEKSRLANENSVYARENRFLMEIVEYHQLTMQDVVYLDEGIEEVTEVYPIPGVSRMLSTSPPSPSSPRLSLSHDEISLSRSSSHHKLNESLSRSGSAKKLSSHIELNDSQEYHKMNKSLSRSGSANKLSSHIELNDSQEYQHN